ncbi:MAG: hypothetical protein WCO98_11285 [bacterium]
MSGILFLLALAGDTAVVLRSAAPVRIDGNFGDWDKVAVSYPLTGMIKDAAVFKAVYDDENLYFYVQVKDDSPLKNSTGLSDAPMLLKGGDAISI